MGVGKALAGRQMALSHGPRALISSMATWRSETVIPKMQQGSGLLAPSTPRLEQMTREGRKGDLHPATIPDIILSGNLLTQDPLSLPTALPSLGLPSFSSRTKARGESGPRNPAKQGGLRGYLRAKLPLSSHASVWQRVRNGMDGKGNTGPWNSCGHLR